MNVEEVISDTHEELNGKEVVSDSGEKGKWEKVNAEGVTSYIGEEVKTKINTNDMYVEEYETSDKYVKGEETEIDKNERHVPIVEQNNSKEFDLL